MVLKIYVDVTRFWYNYEGQYHRLDGPAIEYYDGGKEWYFNSREHVC